MCCSIGQCSSVLAHASVRLVRRTESRCSNQVAEINATFGQQGVFRIHRLFLRQSFRQSVGEGWCGRFRSGERHLCFAIVAVCRKCDCVFREKVDELSLQRRHASAPGLARTLPSMSEGNRSYFDWHTGDRCLFERCYCIAAVAPLLLHRSAFFAASNFVHCRELGPCYTQFFVT